jgi:hypothetical protein
MIEILFLLGFSLHNIEEALWLPQWSQNATRFHKPVSNNEFHFAVIMVTAIGYLFTFQYFCVWVNLRYRKICLSGFYTYDGI